MKSRIASRRPGGRAKLLGASLAAFAACANIGRAEVSGLVSGMLTCTAPAGTSFLIGSNYALDCTFEKNDGSRERYAGDIQRIGLDLGLSAGARMIWAVIVSDGSAPPTLAGTYVGPSAGVTPVIGFGVNLLVGGGDRSVSLQPISVEFKTGINLAVGVAALRLRKP